MDVHPVQRGFIPVEILYSKIYSANFYFFQNFIQHRAVKVAARMTMRWKEAAGVCIVPDGLSIANRFTFNFGEGDFNEKNEKIVSGNGDFGAGFNRLGGFGFSADGFNRNQGEN
ncbi:MAG: hypothetical protein ABI977_24305 [Acidobacteriota bacterium]